MQDMQMRDIVSSLVDNVDKNVIDGGSGSNDILDLDITMSGGAFNANYLVGCLYFLREMQSRNKIRIHRMSSCSASSLIAFLFLTNNLELFKDKLYEMTVTSFKNNKTFIFTESTLQNMIDTIKCSLPPDDETTLKIINKKLYITFFDVKRRTKVVKKKYKTLHDVFETIKKSSYIPFITMKDELLYCNRYMDGCTPYIFERNEKRKQLFISMLGRDKIKDSVVLKNDKNGVHKIINGMLDAYYFFFRGCKGTSMCSYIDNWSFSTSLKYKLLDTILLIICNLLHYYSFHLKNPLYLYSQKYSNSIEVKMVTSFFYILKMLLNTFLEHYCL
jgi:hypothetical protein